MQGDSGRMLGPVEQTPPAIPEPCRCHALEPVHSWCFPGAGGGHSRGTRTRMRHLSARPAQARPLTCPRLSGCPTDTQPRVMQRWLCDRSCASVSPRVPKTQALAGSRGDRSRCRRPAERLSSERERGAGGTSMFHLRGAHVWWLCVTPVLTHRGQPRASHVSTRGLTARGSEGSSETSLLLVDRVPYIFFNFGFSCEDFNPQSPAPCVAFGRNSAFSGGWAGCHVLSHVSADLTEPWLRHRDADATLSCGLLPRGPDAAGRTSARVSHLRCIACSGCFTFLPACS